MELFGAVGERLLLEASRLAIDGSGRMLTLDGETFVVPEESRPIVRTVAAKFDKYFEKGTGRHSLAV